MLLRILTLLGSLGMFLYGMSLMSGGLQKMAGAKLRGFMSKMTSSTLKCIFSGILVTALVQSSTATTLMLLSFVNAGLMSLTSAIGVIMGANIGTTVTAWIFALSFGGSGFSLGTIAIQAENAINLYRDALRDEHLSNFKNPEYDYETGVFYMDIVSELEKMGDFVINISESLMDEKDI